MVNLNGVSGGFVPAYCGGGYKPHNQLVTRTPLGATKNCIMKKVVFFIATALLLALASSLCKGQQHNFLVTGSVQSVEGLPIRPAWVEVSGLPNTKVDTYGPNSHYTISVPSPDIYQTLYASANYLWEPKSEPIAPEVNFKLNHAKGDEGNGGFIQWLNQLMDEVSGFLKALVNDILVSQMTRFMV